MITSNEEKDSSFSRVTVFNLTVFAVSIALLIITSRKEQELIGRELSLINKEKVESTYSGYIKKFYTAVKEGKIFLGPLVLTNGATIVSNSAFFIPDGAYGIMFNSSNCSAIGCSFTTIRE